MLGALWFLFLLLSCVHGHGLTNPNLFLTTSSVPSWTLNGGTVANGSTPEGVCANLTGGFIDCPDLAQVVDTVASTQYIFSCYGYAKFWGGSFGFAQGLIALDAPSYVCKHDPSNFINYTWFSPLQPSPGPPIWMNVVLQFTAVSAKTVVMAHGDNNKWACFKNCTFGPVTVAPTSPAPTPPTQAPTSRQPSVECVTCSVPSCPDLSIKKQAQGCKIVEDLAQVIGWTRSPAWARIARNVICSTLSQEANQSCHHNLNRDLYVDVCDVLRESLFSGFIPQFNEKWCFNASANLTYPIEQWNSTLNINYTANTNQAACVERQKYETDSTSAENAQYVALGPLADVLANPQKYPNFPAIKTVKATQTTAILYNTACLESRAIAPGWYVLLGIFLAFAAVSGVLLFRRRKLPPVKARDGFLMWGGLVWVVVNVVWIAIDQLTGNTASCGLISFGNLVAFPMLLFFYLLRALRLLFLYKWAEGKVKNQAWFHSHRSLVRRKSFLISSGIFFLICVIIFTATNVVDDTFAETFLSSGRCEWWDINQQVIEAASEAGVPLLPTDFNPNGFVPYSVEYSSCVFCSTFGTQVLMCIVTVILLCLIISALLSLRNINDQFKLLFELVLVLIALSIVAIVRSIMFFPSAASSVMATVGSDLGAILLATVLFFLMFISAVYPALLTYTRRFQVASDGVVSALDGKVEGTPLTISLSDVLNDQFGLDLYKQFALESFAVENVMYWCAIQEFESEKFSVSKRSAKALEIYETFIRQGAVMEVNVESPIRVRYDKLFGVQSTTYLGLGGSPAPGDLSSTLDHETEVAIAPVALPDDVFQDVTHIVFGLMQTNCWLRFKKSPFWRILTVEMQARAADANPIASESGTQMSALRHGEVSFRKSKNASMRSLPE